MTCLFFYYRLEGQDLSPESSRLLKFLDVDFTTTQYEAIAEAERNREIITVSQILRGFSKE